MRSKDALPYGAGYNKRQPDAFRIRCTRALRMIYACVRPTAMNRRFVQLSHSAAPQ